MRRKVYRSLDRSASIFGIHGRFLMVVGIGGALALMVGLIVGSVAGMIIGASSGLALAGVAYLYTLSLQSKMDEKAFLRIIVKRGYPRLYRFSPKHIRNIWKGFNLPPTSTEQP